MTALLIIAFVIASPIPISIFFGLVFAVIEAIVNDRESLPIIEAFKIGVVIGFSLWMYPFNALIESLYE